MRIGMATLLVCACSGGGKSAIDATPPEDPRQIVATLPVNVNRNLDLLFVIDNSTDMASKQMNLANNFPNFINVLNAIEGGLPDVHIGVTTTDMGTKPLNGTPAPAIGVVGQGGCANTGDDGKLKTNGAMVTGSFISDIKQTDGTRLKNYTGNLADVFATMVKQGGGGCGFEQPLHAMQRALQNTQANPGFLRPDAKLGIIFLGDEDDCSATDGALFGPENGTVGPLTSFRCTRFGVRCEVGGQTPDEMNTIGEKINCSSNASSTLLQDSLAAAAVIKGMKQDPRNIFTGAIVGNPTPLVVEQRMINGMNQIAVAHSCMFAGATGPEVADPGLRLKRFLDQFSGSQLGSICQNDLSDPLSRIADLARHVVGNPCISGNLVEPLDCIVEDDDGTKKTPLTQCGSPETPPCWKIVTDLTKCPAFGGKMLAVVRSEAPPPSTITTMRCKVF